MDPRLQPFAAQYPPAFLVAMGFTLAQEGWAATSDHPADAGGATRYGIAQAHHPEAWRDGPPTLATALGLYLHKFWWAIGGDELPAPLAVALMDSAVLFGPARPARWLQEALGVATDGVIGPRSIAAAKAHAKPHGLAQTIAWRRMEAHAQRVAAKPDQAVFITGWTRRCAALARLIDTI